MGFQMKVTQYVLKFQTEMILKAHVFNINKKIKSRSELTCQGTLYTVDIGALNAGGHQKKIVQNSVGGDVDIDAVYTILNGTLIWYAADVNKPMRKVKQVDADLDENTDATESVLAEFHTS
jgi:hypothetical protein